MSNNLFFSKIMTFMANVEKYGTARQATYEYIIECMFFALWISKSTETKFRICNIHCFYTAKMFTRQRLHITFTRTFPVLFYNRTKYYSIIKVFSDMSFSFCYSIHKEISKSSPTRSKPHTVYTHTTHVS
jgi:hypothetical protein